MGRSVQTRIIEVVSGAERLETMATLRDAADSRGEDDRNLSARSRWAWLRPRRVTTRAPTPYAAARRPPQRRQSRRRRPRYLVQAGNPRRHAARSPLSLDPTAPSRRQPERDPIVPPRDRDV